MRTPEETLEQLDVIEGQARARRDSGETSFEESAAERDIPDLVACVRELDSRVRASEAGIAQEQARADRAVAERRAALSVTTREGLSCSEWLLRTGLAERERDELRAAGNALHAKYDAALTVLRWARITDHPIYGLGVHQGLSTDDDARAALGRIRADLEAEP